jgi:hypothetical protein
MLTSVKTFVRNYFTQVHDVRNMDAMSTTLHDCLRLVNGQQQSESSRTGASAQTPVVKMKRNLDSPQPHFIKSA